MAVEVAQREVEDTAVPNRTVKADEVATELRRLPYDGAAFASRQGAKAIERELNAVFVKTGQDGAIRAAAFDALEKIKGEEEEEDREGLLDKPQVQALRTMPADDGLVLSTFAKELTQRVKPRSDDGNDRAIFNELLLESMVPAHPEPKLVGKLLKEEKA